MQDIIPSYLTKDFLKRTLENGLQITNIEVDDFTVSSASGKGENYTSEILRVCVSYKVSHQISQQCLILKNIMIFAEGDIQEAFDQCDIIQNEIIMYSEVIPQIEKLLVNSIILAPKYFGADRKGRVIILDDLKALGYKLQNRTTGLDEEHCIMVMKNIAQFHAGSMYIAKKNPKYIEIFKNPMFNEFNLKSDQFTQVFIFNFDQMINVVRAWPEYEAIVVKLEKICSDLMRKGFEHCQRKEGELQVINHGDLWVNNMMFKSNEDSKGLLDVVFVDFQLSYYGSLGIDLNYFLNTSVQLETLKSKRTELLTIYYETFKTTLEQLKYTPIPTWEEVSKEVRAKELYGLISLGSVFPIIIMDKSASQNNTIDTMLDDSKEKINAMFGSERMKNTLKYSLKRFDELGVLDE